MTTPTTIKLQPEVKAELERENTDGETYSETVGRLLGVTKGQVWTEDEIREIVRDELRQLKGGVR